jgi:hypothetical protein
LSYQRNFIEYILGPKCFKCNKYAAGINVCVECIDEEKFNKIRNLDRHFSHTRDKICRICSSSVDFKTSVYFCYTCVPLHPDDTHRGGHLKPSDPEIGWWGGGGYDDENKTACNSCDQCGGLLIREIKTNNYWYYKKGNQKSTKKPFKCDRMDKEELLKIQENCNHILINVLEIPPKSYSYYAKQWKHILKIDEVLWLWPTKSAYAIDLSNRRTIIEWCKICGVKKISDKVELAKK